MLYDGAGWCWRMTCPTAETVISVSDECDYSGFCVRCWRIVTCWFFADGCCNDSGGSQDGGVHHDDDYEGRLS
jgi:hypothetical protein